MKRKSRIGGALTLAAGILLCLYGCADHETHVAAAPPPPPPDSRPRATYDYPHEANKVQKRTLRRKLVVALVRMAEDRPVDDVPFGPQPETAPAGDPAVQVNVQSNVGRQPRPSPVKPGAIGQRNRQALKRELLETGAFMVIERDSILDLLRELQFGESRYTNPDVRPDVGEIIAVQYLLEASLGPNPDQSFKDTVARPPRYDEQGPSLAARIFAPDRTATEERFRDLQQRRVEEACLHEMNNKFPWGAYLSLYNVRTSTIAAEAFGIGATELEALRDAVEELVDKCLELAEPPRIAAVDGERVFLDLGHDDNVEIGQKYRYVSQGRLIRNASGQVIGRDEQEGGLLEITRVEKLMSAGKVIRRVADPAVGDRIEPE